MRHEDPRASRLLQARPVRAIPAVLLALTVASAGAVVAAGPASAAAPTLHPPASPSANPSPSWTFDAVTGASYECSFTLATEAPAFRACTSSFRPSRPLASDGTADGTYEFEVRDVADVADSSAVSKSRYELDTLSHVADRGQSTTSPSRLLEDQLGNPEPKAIGSSIADSLKKPTIPLVLVVIVVGFLLLQNRIDRRDPKLASAPAGAEPELEFGPVRSTRAAGQPLGGGAPE